MKKIGLVGEDPNDTDSIKNLLNQKFNKQIIFSHILRNKRGYQLDNTSTLKSLEIELRTRQYDYIFFIRDLDGLRTEERKYQRVQSWYNKLNKICKGKGLLLVNIFELEALIFADLDVFNKIYNTTIKANRNVMFISEPKEELIRVTAKLSKTYKENHCPDLFSKLRFDIVVKNCKYFSEFIDNINSSIFSKRKKLR